MQRYWLNHYFPRALEKSIAQMPEAGGIVKFLKAAGFVNVYTEIYEIAADLQDLFLYSGKHRPELYLDPSVRSGISTFAGLADPAEVAAGCKKLEDDIKSGEIWDIINSYRHDRGDYLFIAGEKLSRLKGEGGIDLVEGISHLTFIVQDLERSSTFFKTIFNAKEIYSSGTKTFSLSKEKFFLVGGQWICIMEGDPLPERTYNHVSFKINNAEFDLFESRVRALGVDIRPSRPRVEGEGRSLYFYDFDNHLFEMHTGTLSERLECYEL